MPARWIGSVVRLAALVAAVLIGPDGAEAQLESSVAAALSSFSPLAAAAAESPERSKGSLAEVRASSRRAGVRPGVATYSGGSLSALFNRGGLLGGFAAGFLGCGLLGFLFGRGVFGGLGGATSYFGLGAQLALLATLCWLIWSRWRGGEEADLAVLSPRQLADPYLRSRDDLRARFEAPPDEAHSPGGERQ